MTNRPPADSPDAETDFGFASVRVAEKAPLVRDLFDRVADRYDLMNDLMSGGLHRLWKTTFLDDVRPRPGTDLLDVAGGTGDIAVGCLERAPGVRVTVVDSSTAMLQVGRRRARAPIAAALSWICADAEALPLPSCRFDAYTIAFGLRNVARRERALSEARRVLKPGGRFLCLEFSRFALPLLGPLYDAYSLRVIPWLGGVVAQDRAAYRYLVESIRKFPAQDDLRDLLTAAGFERAAYRNLAGGIVAIHSAWRL
jgi:demethylmenaquinone methyltransferase/2-methoxy-6-polyprenyl-1,4-benzoquinol methylase